MAKFKAYDYRQRVFLPVSLEDQLMPGTLEFAIHTLVETRLDTSAFEQKYRNDETGRTAYDPKILLKIVLPGFLLLYADSDHPVSQTGSYPLQQYLPSQAAGLKPHGPHDQADRPYFDKAAFKNLVAVPCKGCKKFRAKEGPG